MYKVGDRVRAIGYYQFNGLIVDCDPTLEELRYKVRNLDKPDDDNAFWLLGDRHLEPKIPGFWARIPIAIRFILFGR